MDSAPPLPSPKPVLLDWVFRVLGFLTMAMLAFALPLFPTMELDASWRMALGKFFMEGRQFGKDIVFTYGPLGFSMGKTYWGSHWGVLVAWHTVQALVFTTIVYWHAYRLVGYRRTFFFLFFFFFGLSYQDAMHQSIITLTGMELIRRSNTSWRWSSTALLLLLVILSLVKFTNMLLAFFLVLLAGALEFAPTRNWRSLRLPALFVGLFLAGWVLCGQNLLNLPAYFHSSWEISQGYQDSMGLSCPSSQLYVALVVAGLMVCYLALSLASRPDRLRGMGLVLGTTAYLYLNWKHGFIRADGHQIGFYYAALTVIVSAPLLLEDSLRWRRAKIAVLAIAGLLSTYGMEKVLSGLVRGAPAAAQDKINTHLAFVTGQGYGRDIYEGKLQAERGSADLRMVKAAVGEASVDVLGFEQAIALFNDLNYQPRPVFQGYSAYTPYLSRLNGDYFASDRAPEFVLFKLQTLDGRLATMDDPHSLRLLIQRYTYLLSEQGFTLWQRKPGPFDVNQFEPTPISSVTHRIGESIAVPAHPDHGIWVEIHYRFSLLGKLRRFLFKPPLVQLRITDESGTESVHRLPQPIGRTGFMLSPIANDLIYFMRAAGGGSSQRAASLKIEASSSDLDCLKPEVRVSFYSLPRSDAGRQYFAAADKAKFHMFRATPISYEALNPPVEERIENQLVMVMHAPSRMTFEVPPGATMMQGSYGFLPGAYTTNGYTNGATFSVQWTDGSEVVVLHERHLAPLSTISDRGLQSFSVRVPKATGFVSLRVAPGANNEYAYDWTAWADIEFK